jgi:hypothetical protein
MKNDLMKKRMKIQGDMKAKYTKGEIPVEIVGSQDLEDIEDP